MAFIIAIILFICERLLFACLIENPINSKECYCCKQKYYYNFSDSWPGGEALFNSSECVYQRVTTPLIQNIYISPLSCSEIKSSCFGTAENPFDSLVKAFKYGWRAGWLSQNSTVNFFLLSDQKEGEGESSIHFINKVDYPGDYQYLFRRFYADITLAPLYCKNQQNISRCIRKETLKPIIYVRASSLFIFISKSFFIRNIIFDGSELGLQELGLVNETFYRKPICNDWELNSRDGPCGLRQKQVKKLENFPYGLFNFEPIIDCKPCYQNSVDKFWITDSEFRFFHSFGKNYRIGSLITVQFLKFSIQITNSSFFKMALVYGVLNSIEMPPYYADQSVLYANGLGKETAMFLLEDSKFKEYNFFEISFASPEVESELQAFCFLTYLPLNFYVKNNVFMNNKLPSYTLPYLLMKFDIQKSSLNTPAIFNLTNNTMLSNEMDYFIKVYKLAEYSQPKHKFNLIQNFFIDNVNFSLDTCLIDINFEGNLLKNVSLYKFSFFRVNFGRVYLRKNVILFLYNQMESVLIEFVGVQFITDKYIFQTSAWTNKTYMDLLYLEENYFSNINSGIFQTKYTLNQLIMNGNYYEMIVCKSCIFFGGNVEMNFSVSNNIFNEVSCDTIFSNYLFKNLTMSLNYFIMVNTNGFTSSNLASPSKPNSVINFTQNVLLQINFTDYLVAYEGLFEGSLLEINFFNNILSNINGYNDKFVIIFNFFLLNFSNNFINSIKNSSFIKLQGLGQDDRRLYFFNNTLQGSYTIEASGCLLQITDLNQFSIKASNFIHALLQDKFISAVQITSYYGFLEIIDCLFKNLIGRNSGALTIKVLKYSSFLIKNCAFFGNIGNDLSADLSIETLEISNNFTSLRSFLPLFGFGIVNNIFSFSKGGEGGSIRVLDGSQTLLQNNYFSDIRAQQGSCLNLGEKSFILSFKNTIHNSYATFLGGYLSAFGSYIYLQSDIAIHCGAERGGILYAEDSVIKISFVDYSYCLNNLQGGVIFAQSSRVSLLASSFSYTSTNKEGGGIFMKRGGLNLRMIKFSNSCSDSSGGVLYLEAVENFSAKSIQIFNSQVAKEGVVFLLGLPQYTYTLTDITCESIASGLNGIGECIYMRDGNLKIFNITLLDSNITTCALFFSATAKGSSVLIVNLRAEGLFLKKNLLISQGNTLDIINLRITNLLSLPTVTCLYMTRTFISLSNVTFTASQSFAQRFLKLEESNLRASYVSLNLNYRLAAVTSTKSSLYVISSNFNRGKLP